MAYFFHVWMQKIFLRFEKNVLVLIMYAIVRPFDLILKLNFLLHRIEGTWNYLSVCESKVSE